MCGILGVFGKPENIPREKFEKALETLSLRGPDGEGTFFDSNCYLGHKRLSIIDLEGGKQPMQSGCGRYVVVFNGEIYNYKEIKRQLSSKYRFLTDSDTEVILAGYIEYGQKVVDHLEGMFSFVIYDRKENKLFLARDPIGIKPLVYAESSGTFYFASEIKALLPLLNERKEISGQALFDFFCFKHIPAPYTIYQNIYKLPAGHYVEVKLSENGIRIDGPHAYWRPQYTGVVEKADIGSIKEQILKTVEFHLAADVPLGVFLSGGIDSTAIVWAMNELGKKINTYTVGFSGQTKDKDPYYAKLIADQYQTNHHELIVELGDYGNEAKYIYSYLDEPFADPAFISTYYVAKATAAHVKVVLSGDGADELFFGYDSYVGINYEKKIRKLFGNNDTDWILEKYFGYDCSMIKKLLPYAKHYTNSVAVDTSLKDGRLQMRMFDLNYTLPEYYLYKTDKSSMMNSLEVRTPFTHRPLVDYILSISLKNHYKNRRGKKILRDVLAGRIPYHVLHRPKQGFSRPVHLLLDDKNLFFIKEVIKDIDLFDSNEVNRIVSNYIHTKEKQSIIWRLLVFSWWFEGNKHYISH